MSALGLAIMIVAGAVTLDVVLENTRNTDASVVGQTVSNVDLGGFFTAGVLVGVALMLGLMLLLAGLRRANRKRQERKELERSYAGTATQAETLQEERDRLAAELEEERRARRSAESAVPAGAGATSAGATTAAAAPMADHDRHGEHTLHDHGVRGAERPTMPANDAPVYPSEPATGPMTPTGPTSEAPTSGTPTSGTPTSGTPTSGATATQERPAERTKPSLKQRLLGS